MDGSSYLPSFLPTKFPYRSLLRHCTHFHLHTYEPLFLATVSHLLLILPPSPSISFPLCAYNATASSHSTHANHSYPPLPETKPTSATTPGHRSAHENFRPHRDSKNNHHPPPRPPMVSSTGPLPTAAQPAQSPSHPSPPSSSTPPLASTFSSRISGPCSVHHNGASRRHQTL